MCWIPKSHVMKDGTCNITPASDPSKDGIRYWNYDNAVLVFDVQRNQWGTIEATSKNPGLLGPNGECGPFPSNIASPQVSVHGNKIAVVGGEAVERGRSHCDCTRNVLLFR